MWLQPTDRLFESNRKLQMEAYPSWRRGQIANLLVALCGERAFESHSLRQINIPW